ncbi:MAG: YecH family metal-binding protein [Opitutales bacterium]|jgi:probable metal-binding protein
MIKTTNEHHAHKVMEMMIRGGKSYNRESLLAEIRSTFGEEARFCACSVSGMDADALIDFLNMKGKFSGTADNFRFDPGRMCQGH